MAQKSLKDITDAIMRFQLGTRAFSSGALAIGGTKTKVKVAAAIQFCIDNINYVKAITDDVFTHTDVTVQAANTTKYYLLTLDSSGNGTITQGTSTALPDCPASQCPVGYLKIVTAATTFTPATDDHDKAAVTVTYVNLSQMPLALA